MNAPRQTPRGAPSSAELLVLHAVRVTGVADDDVVARRSGIDQNLVEVLLRDFEAYGWVTRVEFAGTRGWTLSERGRLEDSRKLAAELATTGARDAIEAVHCAFLPLNARVVRACTDWQLRPDANDRQGNRERLATNDHADPMWDTRVLDELSAVASELVHLTAQMAARLERFDGYQRRFSAALGRARDGRSAWVAGVEVPSCHRVWMELHEDLLSTLGIARGTESTGD